MNLNNIDDIFKEGLAEYSEQPSKGLWNKVSGKLLRYELFRLNFTNVPKLWLGLAAAGVVAVSLFMINPFATEPENNELTVEMQKDTPVSEDTHPNESIFIPMDAQTKNNQEQLSISPSDSPGSVASSPEMNKTVLDENPEPNNTIIDPAEKTDQAISIDNTTPYNIVGNKDQAVDATSTKSKQLQVQNNLSNSTEEDEPIINELAGERQVTDPLDDKTKVATGVPATAIAANKLEPAIDAAQLNQTNSIITEPLFSPDDSQPDLKIAELETRDATLAVEGSNSENIEIQLLNQPNNSLNSMTLKNRETGQLQNMRSKPFSPGLFQGKYKPPKREFNYSAASIYKLNKPYYTLAAYFSPEITEYARMASSSWEISYIGGLSVTYNNERFIIESGIEYSYTNDLGDYMVDMHTYDSIGYYNEVGSFLPDPNNPGQVIFETNTVMVYDTVQHNLHQQTQNHYSYFHLPLMIGYQAVESGLFSAYIKAGPNFSFLLNKQEQTLDFFNPDATINQIKNYTPVRQNTSIQVLVSVRFKFQLNENLGILAEPTYRYYLKSVYDNTNNTLKNPYGIGLRFGLYYDL
jgi:hypothetical protein